MGGTGNRFNSQFIKVLNLHFNNIKGKFPLVKNTSFDVLIVNSIQYQCSMGITPIKKKLRDSIFEALWGMKPDSFEQDLMERLELINPDIIINASTSGLRSLSGNAIINYI